jgi:hypothetical protein
MHELRLQGFLMWFEFIKELKFIFSYDTCGDYMNILVSIIFYIFCLSLSSSNLERSDHVVFCF